MAREADHRKFGELRDVEPFAAEPEARARDPAHRKLAERQVREVGAGHRVRLQDQVDAVGAEQPRQVQRRVARDFDVEPRIVLARPRDQRREPAVHDRLDHADADRAHVARGRDLAPHLVVEPHDPLRVREHAAARRRERGRARVAIEQAHVERFFERRDAARHGRLRRMQLFGGQAEIFELREPDEGFKKPDVHRVPDGERGRAEAAESGRC
ncbi:hypothetical protein FEP65_05596 [Burkholderia multivorans]|nr:hypothetical protein [Burkholderia multivorans]